MRVEWNYFQWKITILIFGMIVNRTLSCLWSALTSVGPPSVQAPQLVDLPFGDEELLLDPLRGLLWSPEFSFCCHVDWNVKCKESPAWWQSLSRTWRPLPVSPEWPCKTQIWDLNFPQSKYQSWSGDKTDQLPCDLLPLKGDKGKVLGLIIFCFVHRPNHLKYDVHF